MTTLSLSTNSIAHHHVPPRVGGDVLLVRHHNDRDSTLVQLLKNCHDLDTRSAVEISGRLIRKHHFGIVNQRAGDRDALLLTT